MVKLERIIQNSVKGDNFMGKIRFIKKYADQSFNNIYLLIIGTIMYVGVILINPLILQFTIDHIAGDLEITSRFSRLFSSTLGGLAWIKENLWIIALFIMLLSIVSGLALFIRNRAAGKIGEETVESLRNNLFDHLQKLPFSYHTGVQTGDLIQRATSDVEQVNRFLSNQLRELVYAFFMIIVSMIILLSIDLRLTLISMIVFPFIFIFAYVFFKKMQEKFRESDEAEAALSSLFQESLDGVRVIKAFNRELYELNRFEEKNKAYRDKTSRMIQLMGIYWGTSDFLCFLQVLIVTVASIFMVRAGTLSLGNAFVFISYITMVLWPIRNVGRILSDMGKLTVAIDRLNDILEEEIEDLDSGISIDLKGKIEFENLVFTYSDGNSKVLKGISFTVEPNETVAIMGPTGSGKSSLVQLITRLYDLDSGRILFDGVDACEISKRSLRSQIGIVLQEPFLFSKSIYDNISIASKYSKYKDVYSAADLASIHDVIQNFDQGYKTMVGEKGVTLSGGQKQRIAIARTVLMDQQILIFDDSLSALDSKTDLKIRDALNKRDKKSTTLIITHRVNTAMKADKIIMLDEGIISQIGTHQQLIKEEGIYRRIAGIQGIEGGAQNDC